jgi:hypothetical protein
MVVLIFSHFVPLSMVKAVGHPVQCYTSIRADLVYNLYSALFRKDDV